MDPAGLALLLAAVACLVAAADAARHRQRPGATVLAAATAGATLWAFGTLGARLATDPTLAQALDLATVAGSVTTVLFAFLFAAAVGRRSARIRWPLAAVLLVEPTFVLVTAAVRSTGGSWLPGRAIANPFWAHVVYSYALVAVAAATFVHRLSESRRRPRRGSSAIVVGLATPWLANVLYLFGPVGFDPTPIALGVSGLAVLVAIREPEFPVARATADRTRSETPGEVDRVARALVHDLRNPLSVAMARIELATEAGDAGHLEHATRALERVDRLLENASIVAGGENAATSRQEVSLAKAARDAWAAIPTASATLSVRGDVRFRADPTLLGRLLENLFANAVRHGGGDVAVTVGALQDGFFVADDGPGIDPADREVVWEPDRGEGTGLGLAIVRTAAAAHGWDVSIGEGRAGGARVEVREVDSLERDR